MYESKMTFQCNKQPASEARKSAKSTEMDSSDFSPNGIFVRSLRHTRYARNDSLSAHASSTTIYGLTLQRITNNIDGYFCRLDLETYRVSLCLRKRIVGNRTLPVDLARRGRSWPVFRKGSGGSGRRNPLSLPWRSKLRRNNIGHWK